MNELLVDEFTAINQYLAHREKLKLLGYKKLACRLKEHIEDERDHVHKLMKRILFLGGEPYMSQMKPMNIGKDVKSMLESDKKLETACVKKYNDAVDQAVAEKDNGTMDVFIHNLCEEESHLRYLMAQLKQIDEMGIESYLSTIK
jgi:bacterioferritin